MDNKRLKELAGITETTELDKLLNETKETKKTPKGKRPNGIGWSLKQAGEQTGKDYSIWERTTKRVENTNKRVEEGVFGQAGYGGEKNQEQQVVSELAQMLRDIKIFIRDGNMKDAAMMVDRAYSRAAGANRGA